MLVGLAPLFWALDKARSWKSAAFRAWLYVFLGNSAICAWVAHSVNAFTSIPLPLSVPAVFVLSVFEQGSWVVLAALRHVLHRNFGIRPVFWTPAALLFLDVCWPKFFPNTMGSVFYGVPWLAQAADVTGVWGLTALLGATSEAAAALFSKTWPRPQLLRHGAAALGLFAAASAYGAWRLGVVRDWMTRPAGSVRVAVVQPNVNAALNVRAEADREGARAEILRRMTRLTDEALKLKPDFVFWPETSYPDTYHGDSSAESRAVTAALDAYLRQTGVPLLFGARDQVGKKRYNALFLVRPDARGGLTRDVYHKSRLLVLAEHVPLSEYFPELAYYVRSVGGTAFFEGGGPQVLEAPRGVRLGAMICLEGLYARFVRQLALKDAQVLVNATNDAWFGDGMEPALHLYLTAFRSIETRRPMVRSTNTGHSAVVDIDGTLRVKTDLFTERVFAEDVPYYSGLSSPYLFLGDWLIALAGLYALFPFALTIHSRPGTLSAWFSSLFYYWRSPRARKRR
jgi:apolipoprotein N-acyltransferase